MPSNHSQDTANTMRQLAETVSVLVHIGFDKNAAVAAVTANDLSKLAES